MTQDFSQPFFPVSLGGGRDITPGQLPAPIRFRTFPFPKTDLDAWPMDENGKQYQAATGFEIRFDDLSGGYLQQGDFARGAGPYDGDYRCFSSSTNDSRKRRHLLLASRNTATNPSANTSIGFMCWTNVFSTLVIAQNNTVGGGNIILFKEITPDGGLTNITYAPADKILSLNPIVQGGTAVRLVVGLTTDPPEILSDLTTGGPTSAGSMHANLSDLWAMAQSPINASSPGLATNLFYAGSSIYTLSISAAIGTAPTQVQTGLIPGGFGMGIEKLEQGDALRWHLAIPEAAAGSGVLDGGGSPLPVKWTHFNLEGTDPQLIPFSLSRQLFPCLWQQKAVATDGVQIKAHDGLEEEDLNFLDGRPANSDMRVTCQGLIVNGRDLISITCHNDLTASGTTVGNTYFQLEQYSPTDRAWLPISGQIVPGKINASTSDDAYLFGRQIVNPCAPTHPLSKQTGIAYITSLSSSSTMQVDRIFIPPPGVNPFLTYRQTGSTAYGSQQWNDSGVTTTPYLALKGLEGRSKRVDQVVFEGEVPANTQVLFALNGGAGILFDANHPLVAQSADLAELGLFDVFYASWTLSQTSGTTRTPNGLPVLVRGRAYLTDPATEDLGLFAGPT